MSTMTTLSEVLNKLKKEGYTVDFNLGDNCLECHGNALKINPEDFVVDRHYRFEGYTDPGDQAVVYAISSDKFGVKGVLVDGYGVYSDGIAGPLAKKLNEKAASNPSTELSSTPEKSNDATPQRPAGARLLDAPLVEMDLSSLSAQIKEESAWKNTDRNAITIYKTSGMRIVLVALHKGAEMKTHTAPGTISVQVLQGKIRFTTEKKAVEREKGQMLALYAGIPHSVFAVEESVFLLTMALPASKAQ